MSFTQTTLNAPAANTVGVAELNLSDGTSGQVLTTNGSGTLSFADGGVAGISSSADATAITIDSSENVLISKTSNDNSTAGVVLRDTGEGSFVASGQRSGLFNRLSSDGDIIEFRKDGSSVGSIGSISSDLFIAESNVGWRFDGENNQVLPCSTTASTDGTMSIGGAGARVGRIFSSSGINIGGTGAANHLDDYEEGSFTPTLSFGGGTTGISYSFQEGRYIKIGKLVHIQILIALSSKGSSTGDAKLTVPFAIDNISGSTQWEAPASFFLLVGNSNLGNSIAIFSDSQAGIIWAETQGTSTEATNSIFTNTTNFRITGQYQTSA
jgi:hypothetical protein